MPRVQEHTRGDVVELCVGSLGHTIYTGTPLNPILDSIFLKPMSTFFRHSLKAWICLALLAAAASRADEEDLYKSGLNAYIRLSEQDSGTVPNQHPVTLDGAAMGDALSIIQVWEKNWFKPNEAQKVFSTEQARLLGQYIALGLSKATPGQDIIFALARTDKGFLSVMREVSYTSGRAFFANGKLNVIIGEFRRLPDKFQERANASSGAPEVKYFFAHGKRAKPSDFKLAVVTGEGIESHTVGGGIRRDWFEIDIKQAAASLAARVAQEKQSAGGADSEAMRQEAARLAQERREMRLEMARMRRDMEQGTGTPATESAEQRLKTLEELQKKGMISDEEYARKREEILKDI